MSNPAEAPVKAHTPIQQYVYRIPAPPSTWVPSPVAANTEELSISEKSSLNHELTGFNNVDFLKKVTYTNFNSPSNVLDLNHEQRWTAQAVLPFLYLGPTSIARDGSFLQQHGIKMILRIRTVFISNSKPLDKTAANLKIGIHTVDVGGVQDLIAAFPHGIEMINAHMSTFHDDDQKSLAISGSPATSPPGKVLVCCETGNECSPCMVAAYLMAMYAMDFGKAIQIVQAQRFSATFGEESKNILQTYDAILEAKRNVMKSGTANLTQASRSIKGDSSFSQGETSALWPVKANKRSLDELYNDETDTGIAGIDDLGFTVGKREGHAPFQDGRDV